MAALIPEVNVGHSSIISVDASLEDTLCCSVLILVNVFENFLCLFWWNNDFVSTQVIPFSTGTVHGRVVNILKYL